MSAAPTLDGKVALITGGSRGLGREMAFAFSRAGATVAIASRKRDACQAVVDELGGEATAHACHIGRWEEVDALTEAVHERHGRVDVLVNNAGMSPLYPSLVEVSEDLFDKVVGVNLKGPFRLTALVGARMRDGGGGSIINVSSVAAVRPAPTDLPYAAAKAGLDALTVGFAVAYGPSVRVNSIMAGPFLTDISQAWDMEVFEDMTQWYALGRGGRPEEIAGAALYLASDASSFTTGSVLRVDGGQGISNPGVVPGA